MPPSPPADLPQTPQDPATGALGDLPLAARTRALMRRYDLRPVKSLGQNFLLDDNLAGKLVDAVMAFSPTRVLEIGPGLGALTVPLCARCAVVAFEKDRKLEAPLTELLGSHPGFTLQMGDFMEADLGPWLGTGTAVLGNLPYYITTPILEKLLQARPPFAGMVLTMQREVAQRLTAAPGTREFGSLTVFVWYWAAQVRDVCRLGPGVFLPAPDVESRAIAITPRMSPPAEVIDATAFFAGVRAAFGYRRKTLRRALSTAPDLHLDRDAATRVLEEAELDPECRGETLEFGQFVALGNALARSGARHES